MVISWNNEKSDELIEDKGSKLTDDQSWLLEICFKWTLDSTQKKTWTYMYWRRNLLEGSVEFWIERRKSDHGKKILQAVRSNCRTRKNARRRIITPIKRRDWKGWQISIGKVVGTAIERFLVTLVGVQKGDVLLVGIYVFL